MIDKAILAPLAFKIVLHLTGCGLTDVHTGPPGQMISGDLVHGHPSRGSSWPVPAATAPVPGVAALARPVGVVRRARPAGSSKRCFYALVGDRGSVSSSRTI